MFYIIGFVILFFCLNQLLAQTKLLTIEDAISKQKTTLAPARLKQLQWIKDADQFSFLDKKENQDILLIQGISDKAPVSQISVEALTGAMVVANC